MPAGTDQRPPRLHGSELPRERQLAVLRLDRPGAPGDLLGEREPGQTARDGIIAHAVHDAPRSEERVHALGVGRRARDALDQQAADDELAVRRLILEAEATARVALDGERRRHRVARELGEELRARLLVGRPGLDGLSVQHVAGAGDRRQAVDLDHDAILPVEQRRPPSCVRGLHDHAAAHDGQRPVPSPLSCARLHHDSPGLSALRARELT